MTEPCDPESQDTACCDLPTCCCYPERGVDKYLSCVTWTVAIGYFFVIVCVIAIICILTFICIYTWISHTK